MEKIKIKKKMKELKIIEFFSKFCSSLANIIIVPRLQLFLKSYEKNFQRN